jgi:hypothetical protein
MADFADKKKKGEAEKKVPAPAEYQVKPRAIRSLVEGRPTVEKKESPLDGLGREMRSGFKRLEEKLGSQPAKSQDFGGQRNTYNYSYNANSNTTINSPAREKPQFKSPEASSVRAPVIGAITGTAPAATPRAPVSAPASVAPIADQRAHQAFASGKAAHIEADATRMAKISEAAEKMEKGAFPPNPKIREWAGAIRRGQQRQIADLDPKVVNRTLEQTAGGSHGAQQLNTPRVAHIEAEHQTRSQVLQKGLEARQEAQERRQTADPAHAAPNAPETNIRALEARQEAQERRQTADPAHAAPNAPETKIRAMEASVRQPAQLQAQGQPRTATQQEARSFPASNPAAAPVHQMQSPELTSMMRYNDEAHAASAVSAIESAHATKGSKAERSEVKSLERLESPKIGSVSSAPASVRAEQSGPPEPKKAPWGEGKELREMADTLRNILTAVERIG